MQRGIKDAQRGELVSYRHTRNIPVWGGSNSCTFVHGTDLSLARSFDVNPEKIDFFAEDLCRPLYSRFVGVEEIDDLSVLNFISTDPFGGDKTLENCYCTYNEPKKDGLRKCGPNGTMTMESCMQAPIFVSMPHFLKGDPRLIEYVPSLKPNKEEHQTVIKIEPVNLTSQNISNFSIFFVLENGKSNYGKNTNTIKHTCTQIRRRKSIRKC